MRYLICSVFFLTFFSATAQRFPSEQWHVGKAVLSSGETVSGNIKYNLDIQVEVEGRIVTYSANQVNYFSIKPQNDRPLRTFYSLPFRNETGYARPQFFELIKEGKVSLLAREYIGSQIQNTNTGLIRSVRFDPFFDPVLGNSVTRFYLAYNLFIVNPKGQITELGNSRKEVINAFDGNHSDLKKYIKQEKLKMERIADISMLVEYYNKITS